MKKIFGVISIIILIAFLILAKDTEYSLIGCGIVVMILFVFTLRELYKYYENGKEISDRYFTLKRDNLISQIINSALFAYYLINDISNNKFNASKNTELFIRICMLIYVVIQLYVVVIHTPKLSTSGFLCSDGNFIFFNKIKSIKSEDNAMLLSKKLTVNYEDKTQIFKVDNFDYKNIKNHLEMYSSLPIEEID